MKQPDQWLTDIEDHESLLDDEERGFIDLCQHQRTQNRLLTDLELARLRDIRSRIINQVDEESRELDFTTESAYVVS